MTTDIPTMSAEEERDLLARQRDWLLAQIAQNYRSGRWTRDTIHRAYLHDPIDSTEPWHPAPGYEVEVFCDRVTEQAAALGLEAQIVASLADGTAEIQISRVTRTEERP